MYEYREKLRKYVTYISISYRLKFDWEGTRARDTGGIVLIDDSFANFPLTHSLKVVQVVANLVRNCHEETVLGGGALFSWLVAKGFIGFMQ